MSDWSTRLESLLRSPSGQPAEQTIKAIVDLAFEAVFGVCILIASAFHLLQVIRAIKTILGRI
jgi:hypothetical protein